MGFPHRWTRRLPERTFDMSLYRRGSIWWIELSSKSGRIRESSGTADKKAAQEYHEKRRGEIWRQVKLGEKPPVTWGEAVKVWMSLKPRSLQDRYLIASFGFSLTADLPLSTELITKQLNANLTGDSPGSWNRYLSLLIAIHNSVGVSPPADLKRKPNSPGRTRWLSAEEWKRLGIALSEESPLLLQCAQFAVATGLRENNVLNLKWREVSIQARHVAIEAPDIKGRAPLGIPLTEDALAVLRARRGLHKVYVFANPDTGLPLTRASNRAWYNARKKAKLKEVRWHDLRHTYAAWAIQSGVSLQELMHLGGWKTYSMVLRYAHLSSGHLAEAAGKVKPVSLRYNAPKRGKKGTKSPTVGA